jgi:hypothetical protein
MGNTEVRTIQTSTGELSYGFNPMDDGRVEIWVRTPVTPTWTMIGTADSEQEGERTIMDAAGQADAHLSGPAGQHLIMAGRRRAALAGRGRRR